MPTMRERGLVWGRTIFRVLGQNRVSQAGVVVTTATGISMVFLWLIEMLRSGPDHPYAGIILFLILPSLFVLGLVLIPVGFILQRVKDKREGRLSSPRLRSTSAPPGSGGSSPSSRSRPSRTRRSSASPRTRGSK